MLTGGRGAEYEFGYSDPEPSEGIMAYEITADCISCGACQPECPVEVIAQTADLYVIDALLCTDCGACEAVCPVGAIRKVR